MYCNRGGFIIISCVDCVEYDTSSEHLKGMDLEEEYKKILEFKNNCNVIILFSKIFSSNFLIYDLEG